MTQITKKIWTIRKLIRGEVTPRRMVVLYVVVGGVWMLVSNQLLIATISDPTTRDYLEILTDWLYIVSTAWMLYTLIHRHQRLTREATEALRQSERQFRQLAEHIQEALWMYAPAQDRFVYVNPAYEVVWGRPAASLYRRPELWLEAVHPADRDQVTTTLEERGRGEFDEVYRIVHPGGTIRWVQDRSFPILDEDEQVYRLCGITRDITEQVVAQEKLEQRVEERTREIERRRDVAEELHDILRELNSNHPLNQILSFIAARSSQLLETSGAAICHLQEGDAPPIIHAACGSLEACAAADLPVDRETLRRAIAEGKPVIVADGGDGEARQEAPSVENGRRVPGNRDSAPVESAGLFGSVLTVPLVVKDEIYGALALTYTTPHWFSDQEIGLVATLAEHAAMAIENARLRTQAGQAAVAAERSRLARDLHDSVAQALYSMTLYAEATRMAMAAGKQEVVAENLEELHGMAREAMLDMRMLIFELHPSVLENEGLVTALQARLAAVENRAGLQARICAHGERRLPLQIEEELYWIAQEALSNAVKHAAAQSVMVRLDFDDQRVSLEVKDDGTGFDVAQVKREGRMGMQGIEERVQRINGVLKIHSVPDVGTTVKVEAEAP